MKYLRLAVCLMWFFWIIAGYVLSSFHVLWTNCSMEALLFFFSMTWEDPRTSLQGTLRIRASFSKAGYFAIGWFLSQTLQRFCPQGHCSSCHFTASQGPPFILAGDISYFQLMCNHSNSAVFLISSSEWRKCMEAAHLCCLFSLGVVL